MFDPRGPTLFELAEQALSSTERGYDLLAPKFEFTPFRTPDELLEPIAEAVGASGPVDCALDVCCGTGAAMRHLRPHCTEAVAGIDISEGMLREARRRLEDTADTAEVRLVRGDVFAMPFREAFDAATCCGAFGHILPHRQDAFVEQIRRVLRPGGRFVFVTRPMPSRHSATRLAARAFNAAMHVRNALIDPPFVMFYLTFTLERARDVLQRHDFEVDVRAPFEEGRFAPYRLVVATRPAST